MLRETRGLASSLDLQLDGRYSRSTYDCPAVRPRVTISRVGGLPRMSA
jgi:hypothetical protein